MSDLIIRDSLVEKIRGEMSKAKIRAIEASDIGDDPGRFGFFAMYKLYQEILKTLLDEPAVKGESEKAQEEFKIGDEVKSIFDDDLGYVLNPDYLGKIVVSYKGCACPQVSPKDSVIRTGGANALIKKLLPVNPSNWDELKKKILDRGQVESREDLERKAEKDFEFFGDSTLITLCEVLNMIEEMESE